VAGVKGPTLCCVHHVHRFHLEPRTHTVMLSSTKSDKYINEINVWLTKRAHTRALHKEPCCFAYSCMDLIPGKPHVTSLGSIHCGDRRSVQGFKKPYRHVPTMSGAVGTVNPHLSHLYSHVISKYKFSSSRISISFYSSWPLANS
jgi:hypothetical protein